MGIRRSIVGLALAVVVLAGAAPALTSSNGVVISEFRFRGPAGGNDEYVELMNAGSGPVDISAWALQGCSSTTGAASARATVPAGVTLQAGEHYLFTNNNATGPYSGSVTGDRTYATGFTDGAGARIVDASATVIDGVSGTLTATSECREGTGISGMPTTNGDQSYERKSGGTQDTNDNATDFTGPKVGNPQNHAGADAAPSVTSRSPGIDATDVATAANVSVTFSEPVSVTGSWYSISCATSGTHTAAASGGPTSFTIDPDSDFASGESCTVTIVAAQVSDQDTTDPPDHPAADIVWSFTTAVPATPTPIHDIQGLAHISPKNGQLVSSVSGIVIAKASNGFWMQDPNPDADTATSEGIFVFTSSAPTVNVGDAVSVNARVQEFRPGGASNGNLTTTELGSPSVSVLSTGNPLPAPTVIGTGGRIPPDTIIDNDSTGSAETSGIFDPDQDGLDFYESLEGMRVQLNNAVAVGPTATGFGETPVIGDDGANASVRTYRGGLLLRANDGNPERITLDDQLAPLPNMNVGDHYSDSIVGVMDYNFGNPFIEVTTTGLTANHNGVTRETTDPVVPGELAVATFNFENLAPTNPQSKFDGLASLIVNNLRSPDLIAGEEVQDNNGSTDNGTVEASVTLQRLVDAITAAGGPSYAWREIDPVNDQDGGEPGGNIRQVFLFRTDRGLSFVDRPGGTSTNDNAVVGSGSATQLLYSPGRIAPGDSAWNASRKPLAGELTYHGHKLFVVVNHFNSKGGDDPLRGRFQPPVESSATQRHQQATLVANFVSQLGTADPNANVIVLGDLNDFEFSQTVQILETAGLHDLMGTLPLNQRFSYEFEGNAQVLDHIMFSGPLFAQPLVFDPVHVNAEFFDQQSDHDPSVVRVHLNAAPSVSAGGPYAVGEGSSITLTASGSDPEGGTLAYAWDLDNNGSFETPGQSVSFSADDGPATPTVRVQVTDDVGQTATDQVTVTVRNVAPTATFAPPASSFAGFPFTLSLSGAHDPSTADTAAGFTYAFDCGADSGYGAFGTAATASCPTGDVGTRSVAAKIRDKNGDVTEYTGTVSVVVTFDSLCALVRSYARHQADADELCALLDDAKAARNPKTRANILKSFRNTVDSMTGSQTGKSFTADQGGLLKLLSTRL